MSPSQLDFFDDIDVLQVGARNMQNFELLKELGKLRKPVLLKRNFCATLNEFLMAAEYIIKGGNENVILCLRGIRTFAAETRFTADIGSIPALKKLSHLPIIFDPSHAAGRSDFVPQLAFAATAAGCDGLMVEVHDNPAVAMCDGAESLNLDEFAKLAKNVAMLHGCVSKFEK
jgi:3-deoxy-7-phosphoheptulonate synthase